MEVQGVVPKPGDERVRNLLTALGKLDERLEIILKLAREPGLNLAGI